MKLKVGIALYVSQKLNLLSKTSPTRKTPSPYYFTDEFYQILNNATNLTQMLSEDKEGGNTS